MILASEIGDKTFFIAAILAMNHSRLTVRYERRDDDVFVDSNLKLEFSLS